MRTKVVGTRRVKDRSVKIVPLDQIPPAAAKTKKAWTKKPAIPLSSWTQGIAPDTPIEFKLWGFTFSGTVAEALAFLQRR